MSNILSEPEVPEALASETPPTESDSDAYSRATVRAVFAVLYYQGYALSFLGIAAPFIAKSFHLDQSGIARMYAIISLNAFGALMLSRMADRVGRRQIVLLCLFLTPVCSLGAALSNTAAWFIIFEIIVYAGVGATIGSSLVMLAETLPIAKRSEGQGWANFAIGCGGGMCIILAPILSHFELSWRWLLAVPVIGIVFVPAMMKMMPESRRWQDVAATGATAKARFYDVFGPSYRRRSVPLIIATLFGEASGVAVSTWVYYHAVTIVGLSPAEGAAVMLLGGTIGTCGLPLGVWMSERVGRVRSVVILGFLGMLGSMAFYWGPPNHFGWPAVWLTIAHAWFATAGRGTLVAANSAVTELFPTTLRGTMMGWLTLCVAISAIAAQASIAVLATPLGGLSNVVGWIAILSVPCVVMWGLFIDETRGLSLEAAAGEHIAAAL